MPFIILVPLALVVGVALGYILSENPPLRSKWVLTISDSNISTEGTTLETWKLSTTRELIAPFSIAEGFIACDATGRIVFSKSIPEEIRQQLRNTLV